MRTTPLIVLTVLAGCSMSPRIAEPTEATEATEAAPARVTCETGATSGGIRAYVPKGTSRTAFCEAAGIIFFMVEHNVSITANAYAAAQLREEGPAELINDQQRWRIVGPVGHSYDTVLLTIFNRETFPKSVTQRMVFRNGRMTAIADYAQLRKAKVFRGKDVDPIVEEVFRHFESGG